MPELKKYHFKIHICKFFKILMPNILNKNVRISNPQAGMSGKIPLQKNHNLEWIEINY